MLLQQTTRARATVGGAEMGVADGEFVFASEEIVDRGDGRGEGVCVTLGEVLDCDGVGCPGEAAMALG